MQATVTLCITVTNPPTDVDLGVQNGSGKTYSITNKRRSSGADLSFTLDNRKRRPG